MASDAKPENVDSIILEEEIDPNYAPSEAEVFEYAKWLGMDLEKDEDLFWIAREGLKAPLPENWKPCKTKDTDDIYYFNFTTGESTWDHPCDGFYKRLYEEEKKKKEIALKENNDAKRNQAKQDAQQLLGKSDKKVKKKTALEPPAPKTELAPVLDRKPLPGIKPLGPLSSSLGKLEAKPVEELSPRLNSLPSSQDLGSAMPSMKSSSKLGVIGSLRAANEQSGGPTPPGNSLSSSNALDSKPLDRPKYREESKPSSPLEQVAPSKGNELEAFADTKPTPAVIGSRDFGSEKVVAPETVSSYQSPSGGVPSASPFSDQQEKQLRSEIDRLNAELARVSKKAEYWEQESQNSSRKIDQNAVYYNDRINTLDSELLDGRRQLVAKEDELFSIRNSLRNAESDLLRTKDLLQAAQTDASRRQQLHTDQLAVEQRKLTALETQLKEVQMTVYAKDDEIRQLKAAANDAGATSRSSPVASSESDVAVELRAKVQSLQATIDRLESANQLQFDELRDAKRKLDAKDGDMGSLTAEVERLKQQLRLASESSSSTSQETNRQVEFLQNELTQAKDANASLSLALKQKEDEFRKFQQQREQSIGEMRDKLEDAEKSKLFLTHSITEKDQELAVLRRKADLLEQSQTANQDVARSQERELRLIGQHEQEIANMRGKIDDLKHELSLLQINSSSTAASLQAKNEEIESLRTLQAKLHENIKILEKEKHDKDVAHLQLHTQLDAKNIEIARLQNASGQLEYFREVSRVREEEIAQLKLQLMTSVQQAQAAAVKSNEAMLSPTELSELQMENSLLKTKLDTKQVELRSRTEEVHFLQEKLDAAFKDLSAAQNQARSAQSEAKTLKSEVESLQHHLQIETESTAAKDKKIRGFREELLHLQKLLSEAEQAKRRERDTSDAHTQTKAEAPKEVAHVGVQKSVVAYDVGVSATQRVEQRDVGAQASLATAAPPAAPPAVATRVFSVQTDPVQPEVREIVRTVPVPMATAAEPQLEAVITSEMRLQMDYMREVKEELSQKMQQCNLLLSTLAARDAASANRAAATAATTATATAARSGRAVQMNNFLRDTSDDASGDSPPADAATRRASHVQIVRDENVTPNDKARHRRATDRRVDETDDLDSVSDIRSPDDGATFSLVDRLSALFTAVLQGSVGYKASTSGDTRVLHAILGGQQDATAARHAMARLAENKHRALCSLTRDFAAHLTACKDIIRHGRSVVADMKRQYARRANSKDEINELTFDLNLAIRLARKLQETLELVKAQNKELAVDTAQLKGKSRASAGNAVVAMAQLIVGVDRAVESFSSLATTLVNQMSRAATTDSVPSPVGYADRRTLVDDTDDASDFDYELIAQTRPTPALRGRDLYPARSASPPTTRSHRHTTVSGATATLRASSAHGHGGRAASLSPSRRPAKSADYRDKLDIIQHQLNSAQQKHVDSLREYDRHYKWLGSLVKEIGQQATAPAVYRSADGLGKAVDKARLRSSVPLKAINDNILLDGSDAARDGNAAKFHFFL